MPFAHRHHRAARKAGPVAPETFLYEIVDSNHMPDLRGEFAGVKVQRHGAKQVVRLTAEQAKFYLDGGGLKKMADEEVTEEVAPAHAMKRRR